MIRRLGTADGWLRLGHLDADSDGDDGLFDT